MDFLRSLRSTAASSRCLGGVTLRQMYFQVEFGSQDPRVMTGLVS